jgi:uncharacterized protein YcbK (DUF882 family)
MKGLKKILKWALWLFLIVIIGSASFFFIYSNSLSGVNPRTLAFYNQLKSSLEEKGFSPNLLVISARRSKWHNSLLTPFGASSESRHLLGEAIDVMVMDVNDDGQMDSKDVDIVYQILDEEIIAKTGGIGTYKTESWIWNKQMVHFDCRQLKSRWHR